MDWDQHGNQLGEAPAGDRQCCAGPDGRSQTEGDFGHRQWVLQRTEAGDCTLPGLVAELAERGLKIDYRSVWEFVHAEKLSLKKAWRLANATVRTSRGGGRSGWDIKIASRLPWYRGPTLIEYLDTIDITRERVARALRLPVQSICRTEGTRAIAGTVASGTLRVGDLIGISGTKIETRVARLLSPSGDRPFALAGESVMALFADEVDLSRGDMLHGSDDRPVFADQFSGRLLWMSKEHLVPERSYLLKIGTRTVPASVTKIKHQIDVDTGAHIARTFLGFNEIAECNFSVSVPISLDSFNKYPQTACFILIDRTTK